MYRCTVCTNVSKPGQALRRYVIHRKVPCTKFAGGHTEQGTRTEIVREYPVCHGCDKLLRAGRSPADIRLQDGLPADPVQAAPIPYVAQEAARAALPAPRFGKPAVKTPLRGNPPSMSIPRGWAEIEAGLEDQV